jgi:hypothetical protein
LAWSPPCTWTKGLYNHCTNCINPTCRDPINPVLPNSTHPQNKSADTWGTHCAVATSAARRQAAAAGCLPACMPTQHATQQTQWPGCKLGPAALALDTGSFLGTACATEQELLLGPVWRQAAAAKRPLVHPCKWPCCKGVPAVLALATGGEAAAAMMPHSKRLPAVATLLAGCIAVGSHQQHHKRLPTIAVQTTGYAAAATLGCTARSGPRQRHY